MTNTNIFYMDNTNNFQSTENSTALKIEDMLQRLQTFKGEQSFNAANGIDYIGIFNKQSFLKPQIDVIIADYQQYFQSITYVIQPVKDQSVTVDFKIILFSGDVEVRSILVP